MPSGIGGLDISETIASFLFVFFVSPGLLMLLTLLMSLNLLNLSFANVLLTFANVRYFALVSIA
ncbi:MAG: hypothetical protein ACP5I1_08850, partial [Candidatus Hinthialibacter sp.]